MWVLGIMYDLMLLALNELMKHYLIKFVNDI